MTAPSPVGERDRSKTIVLKSPACHQCQSLSTSLLRHLRRNPDAMMRMADGASQELTASVQSSLKKYGNSDSC